MTVWNRLRMWLRAVLLRERTESDMDTELRFHIESYVQDLMRSGVPQAEAMRRARLEFGGLEQTKEVCRDARGISAVDSLVQDVRFGLRMLRKSPGFTAVAVATLALGIGANTAIFSIWNGLLHSSLPMVQNPEQLVMLSNPDAEGSETGRWTSRTEGDRSWLTYGEFEQLRDRAGSFSELMASQSSLGDWKIRVGGGEPEEAHGRLVSGGFFEVLGVRPMMGRAFTKADDQADAPYAVLSYSFWQRRFGGHTDVLGKTFLAVGIAPQDPLTLAAAVLLLAIVALGSAYLPALRASRLDPMTGLRQQ
jgi:hypothetical protein